VIDSAAERAADGAQFDTILSTLTFK